MKNQTRLSCRTFGVMIVLLLIAFGVSFYVSILILTLIVFAPLFFLFPSELLMRLGKLVAKIFLPLLLFSIYSFFVVYSLVLPRRLTRTDKFKALKNVNFEEM